MGAISSHFFDFDQILIFGRIYSGEFYHLHRTFYSLPNGVVAPRPAEYPDRNVGASDNSFSPNPKQKFI